MEHTTPVLRVNDVLPELELAVYDPKADEDKTIKLSGVKAPWKIFFFYPADFTFICPTELEEMAAMYAEFQQEGAEVLSVSRDTVFVHKAWHDHSEAIKKVQFPMVADPSGALCKLFGVAIEDPASGDNGLCYRGTFLIDPDNRVKTIEIHDNSVGRSGKEILRKLKAAKFVREHGGEVCPASWEPGGETLKPGMDLVGKI